MKEHSLQITLTCHVFKMATMRRTLNIYIFSTTTVVGTEILMTLGRRIRNRPVTHTNAKCD